MRIQLCGAKSKQVLVLVSTSVGASVGGSLLSEAYRDTGWFVSWLAVGQAWTPAGHACNDVKGGCVEGATC